MNSRIVTSIAFIALGIIIAAVPPNKTLNYRMTPEQLLASVNGRVQFVGPDEVADMIINRDPVLNLVDLRSPAEYQEFHLPGAINIPVADILNEEYRYIIDQDLQLNIFYSNSSVVANEAWIITRQMGFKNNYVLEGGLNYWAEVIMNPSHPGTGSANEEIARYQFRVGAGRALGGESAVTETAPSTTPLPALAAKPKKKKASGGC